MSAKLRLLLLFLTVFELPHQPSLAGLLQSCLHVDHIAFLVRQEGQQRAFLGAALVRNR